nr:MAG: methyltransferase type 11 [Thermoproteus sp. AZ2]
MKIAISTTNGLVDGPGEGEELAIYEVDGGRYKLVERIKNPALSARAARGLAALAELRRRGVGAVIISEIGSRGFDVAKQWGMKIYIAEGSAEEALEKFIRGELKEAEGPTHMHHGGHGHWHYGGVSEEELELISKYLPPGGVAADLGCGPGRLCGPLGEIASKVYCVDIDADALRYVAEQGLGNAVLLNEDLTRTTIPAGEVDLVVMSNVFHDVVDKEAAVEEIKRVLRPGGYVLIIEHKPGTPFGPPSFVKTKPDEVRRFFNRFKEVEYRDLGHQYAIVFRKN